MNIFFDEETSLLLIEDLGIEPVYQTSTHYIAYCPFHDNRDTPAFNIEKNLGIWRCWNPSCGVSGNILDLIMRTQGISYHQALRIIMRYKRDASLSRLKAKIRHLDRDGEGDLLIRRIPEVLLNDLDYSLESLGYLFDRGFDEETIRYFGAGRKGDFIYIPVRDIFGYLIGFTKRSVTGNKKRYLDHDLPKSKTLFNINNAAKYREVIIVEGPLDAMRVHQSGYPYVVATMMGHLSDRQANILRRNFDIISVFTDNDDAGKALKQVITKSCRGMHIYHVPYIFDVKDPGEMDVSQVRACIDARENVALTGRVFAGTCYNRGNKRTP